MKQETRDAIAYDLESLIKRRDQVLANFIEAMQTRDDVDEVLAWSDNVFSAVAEAQTAHYALQRLNAAEMTLAEWRRYLHETTVWAACDTTQSTSETMNCMRRHKARAIASLTRSYLNFKED